MNQALDRIMLAWKILTNRDGNLVLHAKKELSNLLSKDADEMDQQMARHIVDLTRVFSAEGHSRFSASVAKSLAYKVFGYEPLRPLTGDNCEWIDVGEIDGWRLYQNNRCSHVFRETKTNNWGMGESWCKEYDSEGVVFQEPDGTRYVGKHSRTSITFPYTPKTVYAEVPFNATPEQKEQAAIKALKG